MIINTTIEETLIQEAMTLSQTQKEVIEMGLKMLIQIKKQEQLKNYQGKLVWEGDLEEVDEYMQRF